MLFSKEFSLCTLSNNTENIFFKSYFRGLIFRNYEKKTVIYSIHLSRVDYDEVFVKMEPEEDSKEILDVHNFQTNFIKVRGRSSV